MAEAQSVVQEFPREFGRYYLLAPLAQGGMGALYIGAAGEKEMARLVAIKTVLPHLADAEYKARFRDEAKVVVRLAHSNLVPVFDAGHVDDELFVAMEYIAGKDLRAMWNRCAHKRVAFPVEIAAYIVRELCAGLHYAHSFTDLALVHRDVSPPNVLLSYSGEVKLTDFGLATSSLKMEKTAPGVVYGKVSYMSPEQARGETLDGRSDQYAAAIILWELLTGRQLFPTNQDKPQQLLERAKSSVVNPPSSVTKRVGSGLDEICLRALSPDVEDRYENCQQMQLALSEWLSVNAPSTDSTTLEDFVGQLFSEDIEQENERQKSLIAKLGKAITRFGGKSQLPLRTPGGDGRRAEDKGIRTTDRRAGDRREDDLGVAHREHPLGNEELIGSILDGRYRVDKLIGEGGMGRVFVGEHVEIGKRIAIKVLHPVYRSMPDLVERFRREARAAARIGNKHIVDITDFGTTGDGSAYFVMEYLSGMDLCDLLGERGKFDISTAIELARQVCDALAAAHDAGVIHRDLKPENLLVTQDTNGAPFVKILDFGIAKTTEAEAARERRLTSPGVAVGTPEYMAPEQAAGRPADVRCDIYAVGAIMYEMLSGTPPYRGENFMEILSAKATVDPVPLSHLDPSIPAPISELVTSAMSRDPGQRPQSMNEFANKLVGWRGPISERHKLSTTTVPVLSDTDFTGSVEMPQKSRWPMLAGLLVVASLAVAATLSWRPWAKDSKTPSSAALVREAGAASSDDAMRSVAAAASSENSVKSVTRSSSADIMPTDDVSDVEDNGSSAASADSASKSESSATEAKSSQAAKKEDDAEAGRRYLSRAESAKQSLRWQSALDLALKATRVTSDRRVSRGAYLIAAEASFEMGQPAQVHRWAAKARRSGASRVRVWLKRADAYKQQGQPQKAEQFYRKVLAVDADNKQAKAALGQL